MIIEQAIFGEVRRGHGLRATSGDPVAAADLAGRLDLPDTAPPGADWSPFVLGFPHRNRFVLARIFRDPKATRAGMVLAHALIAPLEEIVLTPDLRPLFDLLIVKALAPSGLVSLDLELGDEVPPAAAELPAAAAALTALGAGPVVRIGSQDLDDLVVSLWGRLWPAIRRSFAFRLSFGPADVIENPEPALVCTPPSLAARWDGYRLLDAPGSRPASLAADLISGHGRGEVLRDFASKIGASLASFSDLSLLEHAYRHAVVEPDTISTTVTAIRLTERLSPDLTRGINGKSELLDRLLPHIGAATADNVLPLRNLVLGGFGNADRLWAGLNSWMAANAFPTAQDASFRSVITSATTSSESEEDWRQAVLGGLASAARAQGPAFAAAFWRWATADPAIVRPLWEAIEPSHALEDRLVSAAPRRLRREAAQPILELASKQRHYRLHGATVSAAYCPGDAARIQVTLEPLPAAEGVRLALRNATPREVVDCAISVADSRVIDLAAENVARTPALLADIDLSGGTARAIWSAALGRSPDAWRGPADPRAAFDAILTDLLDGRPVAPDLVRHLSHTPLADLTGFARRTEIWPKLTGPARDALIRATARSWLGVIADGAPVSGPERELQAAVLRDPMLGELLDHLASGRIGVAVQVVAVLPAFGQDQFRTWLHTAIGRTRPVAVSDSEAIGRLARQRHWQSVVDELLEMLRQGRDDARPALRACASMVSFFDRLRFRLSTVGPAEKWESLEWLAAQLYPTGPDHNKLWERAGGYKADLDTTGNGHSRWQEALSKIRCGSGRPRIDRLLHIMRADYPKNRELPLLAEDSEFRTVDYRQPK